MNVNESTVVRRQLGRQLKELRERAGKTTSQVSAAKLCSGPKLWRIETGRTRIKIGDVCALTDFYQVDDPEVVERLKELAAATESQNYWENSPHLRHYEGLNLYLGLEGSASTISFYHPEFLPGLFQTRAYTERIFQFSATPISSEEIEVLVNLRVQRREVLLDRDPAVNYTMILGGAVLGRLTGPDANVADEQLELLLRVTELPTVDVLVLPLSVGLHAAQLGGFTVMDFDDPQDPTVVCLESAVGIHHEEREQQVALYRHQWDCIRGQAIPLREGMGQ